MINFLLIILLAICGVHGGADLTTKANGGDFNWFVMIRYNGKFLCGGTIIDGRHIITRGTCVMHTPSSDLSILAGTIDTWIVTKQTLLIESIHIHYGFKAIPDETMIDEIYWVHDIAVLKLVNQIIWDAFTAPAAFLTEEHDWNVQPKSIVPGWRKTFQGKSQERFYIRWIEAATYADETCIQSGVHLLRNEKCASWPQIHNKQTIHYYHGSPIVHENVVIGLVDDRTRKQFRICLNLVPYEDFIANTIDDRKYDVSPGEVKYVVSVWDPDSFKCGGIILGSSHILTTGHCVYYANKTNLQIIAGHTQVLQNDPQIQRMSVTKIEVHPDYEEIIDVNGPKSMQIKNNYALLTLAAPLEWGPTIGSVPISNRYFVFTDRRCRAFRWHNAYTVDDKVLLQLIRSEESIMFPEICQAAGIDLEADEMCVKSQYAQHPRSLDSSGNPVVCEGFVVGIIVPNFSNVPQSSSSLSGVLSIWPFINSLNAVCYGTPDNQMSP